ncbi:MAG: hypothetical protein HGJ94_04750 [Desulfosarcina sp.]|nr:hypothetical protein [Desulfosarcina sp.]MBC2744729.1 hypothetical protein [Desulfosarcina sp.]
MKIVHLLFTAFFILSPLSYAADGTDLPIQVRDQIETQTREMSAVGVPTDAARNMLTMMHQNRFRAEDIVQAQQVVMNCAKAGLPTEPVMSKAMEGMAKQAKGQSVVSAMEAVRSRHSYGYRMAKALSDDKKSTDTMARAIADSMAARMAVQDMDAIMAQLQIQTRQQTRNQAENLSLQTMQTVRTMARMGVHSADVSDTLCQALQNRYTWREMKQLRHQIAKQTHQASPQQIASQHAGAIGKGGNANNSGGDGSGSGAGGSGSGSGAGGSGSGSGAGGSGSGSGAGGGGSN